MGHILARRDSTSTTNQSPEEWDLSIRGRANPPQMDGAYSSKEESDTHHQLATRRTGPCHRWMSFSLPTSATAVYIPYATFTMHTFLCTFRTINFMSLPCLAVAKSYATCQTFTCPHQPPSPYSLPCMSCHKLATQDGLMPYVGDQLSLVDVNGWKGEAQLCGNHAHSPCFYPLSSDFIAIQVPGPWTDGCKLQTTGHATCTAPGPFQTHQPMCQHTCTCQTR